MRSSGYHSKENIQKEKESNGAIGRPFNLDVKNRFLMLLLVYYRLYITYTLAGFLFDLDQSNICREIRKIEPLIRKQISCVIRHVLDTTRFPLYYIISVF